MNDYNLFEGFTSLEKLRGESRHNFAWAVMMTSLRLGQEKRRQSLENSFWFIYFFI